VVELGRAALDPDVGLEADQARPLASHLVDELEHHGFDRLPFAAEPALARERLLKRRRKLVVVEKVVHQTSTSLNQ
jgi:hypothetical protein